MLSICRLLPLVAALLFTPLSLWAKEYLRPEVAFQFSARALDERTVEISAKVADDYYLYRDKLKLRLINVANDSARLGELQLPPARMKKDPNFGDTEVYPASFRFRALIERAPSESGKASQQEFELTSMGCADGGICYPPQTTLLTVMLPAAGSVALAPPMTLEVTGSAVQEGGSGDESAAIARLLEDASFIGILASFFGFGLLLSLTPCVLPMVPIVSGIILGKHQAGQPIARRRAFLLSLAYVLGMASTYAAAGVAAGMTGTLLSVALQNPWVLGSFALIFVILSLSMFGFYELQLPTGLQTRLSLQSNRVPGGSYLGDFIMGSLSALIVGPCVAAPLAGALLYIGQTGDAVLGGMALFVMALGMGVPLLAVGASAGALMPRLGAWMNGVKKAFGVLLLATAVWLVSPVLPAVVSLLAWGVLAVGSGIFLRAIDPLPPHAKGGLRFWKAIGVILLLYGSALLIGAFAGASDPLRPLAGFGLQARTDTASQERLPFERVRSVAELEQRLQTAGRPVMLDFYADWCVSCKEMERFTLSDPKVRARLSHVLWLQADVTANTPDDAALLKRFGLFGPPGILFFNARGEDIRGVRVVGFQKVDDFLNTLDLAGKEFKNSTPK